MKLDHPLLHRLGGLLGAAVVQVWMRTLDYKVAYADPSVDPIFPACCRKRIYIFWHEYILLPFYLRGHCDIAMLLSRHRDAEALSHAAGHMGFSFVRGSTNRGGAAALRAMLDAGRTRHLTITPDGPRGPRRVLAPGCIYLASRLQMPLVAMGFGCDRPWRVRRAWDRFAIPRLWSRARAVVSGDICIPPDIDRDEVELWRSRVEEELNRLTVGAEQWAESGQRRADQQRLFRATRPLPLPPPW